jgi:hypothetical protein
MGTGRRLEIRSTNRVTACGLQIHAHVPVLREFSSAWLTKGNRAEVGACAACRS